MKHDALIRLKSPGDPEHGVFPQQVENKLWSLAQKLGNLKLD